MAAITRRTWSEIKEELIRAARGLRYAAWDSRAEHLLKEAYEDICGLYHHRELEEKSKISVAANAFSANYPSDAHIIFVLAELDSEDLPTRFLELVHVGQWSGTFLANNAGRPNQYGTFQRVIYLDRPVDQLRNYHVFYQRRPTAPNFDGVTSPEISEVWDAHIIELALAKAGVRNADDQLAIINAQMYRDFISQQPQPLLTQSTAPARSNEKTQDMPQSGRAT